MLLSGDCGSDHCAQIVRRRGARYEPFGVATCVEETISQDECRNLVQTALTPRTRQRTGSQQNSTSSMSSSSGGSTSSSSSSASRHYHPRCYRGSPPHGPPVWQWYCTMLESWRAVVRFEERAQRHTHVMLRSQCLPCSVAPSKRRHRVPCCCRSGRSGGTSACSSHASTCCTRRRWAAGGPTPRPGTPPTGPAPICMRVHACTCHMRRAHATCDVHMRTCAYAHVLHTHAQHARARASAGSGRSRGRWPPRCSARASVCSSTARLASRAATRTGTQLGTAARHCRLPIAAEPHDPDVWRPHNPKP